MRQQMERKRTRRQEDEPAERHAETSPASSESTLADEIDEILDEIDSVLEQNAEEFVKSYVQKGGE